MSGFRAGAFKKEGMGGLLRRFSPSSAALSLYEIDPAELAQLGKKLILIDVDNTLVGWRSEEIPEESIAWIDAAKAAGLGICILSNTRNPARLERIAKRFDVKFLLGKFKPSREMYHRAVADFGVKEVDAIMIGDQLFTDVLGANRSGIDAIWVRPMTEKDFIGTKFSRMGERFARRALYKHLHAEDVLPAVDDPATPEHEGVERLVDHPIVKQFLKFCVVGGLSFVIDYCVRMTLQYGIPFGDGLLSDHLGAQMSAAMPGLFSYVETPKQAFFPISAFCGAVFGMANSFIWNRSWTFKIKGKEDRASHLKKFLVVSLTGLVLNVLISSLIDHLITGDEKIGSRIATVVAAGIVAFWNFTGQKFFAFKSKE